ncbi:LysR family transcriptional regulator [Musicola paradisiaca]|uniref:Transcriptional regulator, LysR family n=1 Tax=Musicola paradisiaca (strain Ech703) TaxID=579405 RepID=C6C726_MUSP7|nr:LysR family transcriptional regulator [Musicola paradisiaca]ACS85920.1 transcriptional regulator, LysR family [Musicola paradisiaca Ech703]
MNDFSSLPVFVAVVESGSFSAAGKRLNLSKSAVSKRLSQLEERLGVRLLHRTTRQLSLTEAGSDYYDYAQRALQLAQQAEDAVTQLQERPQGTLRVSAPMAFGLRHISPLLPIFLHRYPEVSVDLLMDDRVVDLVGEGFDLAVRIGQLPDSSLIARRLAPCFSVLCAAPDYLQRTDVPQHIDALKHHNCLFYLYFKGGVEWSFEGPDGPVRFQPHGNYRANNSEALFDALLAGVGICQVPKFIVGPALSEGRLVEVLPQYRLPEHSIYAVYPERRHLPAKVRVFIDFLSQHLGEGSDYRRDYEYAANPGARDAPLRPNPGKEPPARPDSREEAAC